MTDDGATPSRADEGTLSLAARISWIIHFGTYLLLLIVGIRVRAYAIVNHDVAWLLVAAERWLGGATFGTDIVEINAPGAMLLYVPPAWLASLTGSSVLLWINVWVASLALISALLVGRIVAHIFERPGDSRQALLTTVVVGAMLIFYPTYDFAQRDHIVAALILPYGIRAMSASDFKAHAWLRWTTAILAALAVCIKPPYIILLAVVFLLNLRRHGWRQAILRTDAVPIAVIGALYAAIIVVAFDPWLTMALGAGRLYAAYQSPFAAVLAAAMMSGLMLLAGAMVATLALAGRAILADLVILASTVMVLYLLQSKGWQYHRLPALLFVWSGLGIVFVASLPRLAALSKAPSMMMAAAMLLVPACLVERARLDNGAERLLYESSEQTVTLRALATPGDAVLYLSASLPPAFPSVLQEGFVWASRYPCLWPLAGALILDPAKPEDAALAKSVLDEQVANVAEDIGSYRPQLIAIDERHLKPHLPDGFQLLALFQKYPAFATAMENYDRVKDVGGFGYFKRRAD